jgi:hypothetical protein
MIKLDAVLLVKLNSAKECAKRLVKLIQGLFEIQPLNNANAFSTLLIFVIALSQVQAFIVICGGYVLHILRKYQNCGNNGLLLWCFYALLELKTAKPTKTKGIFRK